MKQRSEPRVLKLTTKVEDKSITAEIKGKNEQDRIGAQSNNKRVLVSIIDFDFLFENDNSNSFIRILASQTNPKALTR